MSWLLSLCVGASTCAAIALARIGQDAESGTATWDAARATGFASYLLLWAAVISGMSVNLRLRPGGTPLVAALELHRICSTLAAAFLAAHVLALLLDQVVHFSPIDAVLPFTSGYKPLAVGAGTLALWALVAVLITTALAGRMPYRRWRALHFLAYPCFLLALLHGITAGSDSGQTLALAIYAASGATVAIATVYRIAGRGWTDAGERLGYREE